MSLPLPFLMCKTVILCIKTFQRVLFRLAIKLCSIDFPEDFLKFCRLKDLKGKNDISYRQHHAEDGENQSCDGKAVHFLIPAGKD